MTEKSLKGVVLNDFEPINRVLNIISEKAEK
jgi:hypothetical protein